MGRSLRTSAYTRNESVNLPQFRHLGRSRSEEIGSDGRIAHSGLRAGWTEQLLDEVLARLAKCAAHLGAFRHIPGDGENRTPGLAQRRTATAPGGAGPFVVVCQACVTLGGHSGARFRRSPAHLSARRPVPVFRSVSKLCQGTKKPALTRANRGGGGSRTPVLLPLDGSSPSAAGVKISGPPSTPATPAGPSSLDVPDRPQALRSGKPH